MYLIILCCTFSFQNVPHVSNFPVLYLLLQTSITGVSYYLLLYLHLYRASTIFKQLSQVCFIILRCTFLFTPLAQMCLIIFCSTCLLVLPPVTGVSYYLLGYPLLTWLSQVSLNIFRCTCTFTPLPQVCLITFCFT